MSRRTAQIGFWLLCLALLPLPFVALQSGLVPVGRMLLLGTLGVGVWLSDADYISALVGALLVEGILWGVLLYFATDVAVRRLPRAVIAALAAGLMIASLFPIYRTPFSSTGVVSSIFEILN